MTIGTILDNIEKGKKVRLHSLVTSLEKEGVSRNFVLSNIQCSHIGQGQYIILSISSELKSVIERLSVDKTSRCSLATQNKSHNASVGNAFLLIRKESGHPSVVTFDQNGFALQDYNLSSKLIIIENFKNFSMSFESLDFLRSRCGLDIEADTDIVYGSGKSAANKLMKSFYDRYDEIYLFLDLDLGGLDIASFIMNLTDTNCRFMLPNNIDTYLENVVATTDETKLNKIYVLASTRAELVPAANAIIKHRKEFEQEGYLNDY